MYGNIYRNNASMSLGIELVELNQTVDVQQIQIEDLRLKAAKYKAYFYQKHELAEILQKQVEENRDACVGEFDGFCYSSRRACAVYRTLEDMVTQGIIPKSEYDFCRFV